MQSLRKRDLLLSLKYSTGEACFSGPMLNLTLPSVGEQIATGSREFLGKSNQQKK